MMNNKSLKEMYDDVLRGEPAKTPAQLFIEDIMNTTRRSESAVRNWISGRQEPDMLVKQVLSEKFNTPINVLFPKL